MKKELLGQILLEHGVITPPQLQEALSDQKKWGGKLGQHLIRMGALTRAQLLDFLSLQLGIAKIDFEKSPITNEALLAVPKKLCLKYLLIPIAKKEQNNQKRLLVAMADPLDFNAIREVEFVSNCVVTTALATEDNIRRAVEYCYSPDGLRECCNGLPAVSQINVPMNDDSREEAVIFTQEGREMSVQGDNRAMGNLAVRVLIDMLAEKGIISIKEFHERLSVAKDEEA